MYQNPHHCVSVNEHRAVISAFFILAGVLTLVIIGMFTLAFAFSSVSPSSAEVADRFATIKPEDSPEGTHYVSQGDQLDIFYRVDEDVYTKGSCTIAATGVDQNGLTTILTARHCISDENLARIEIGSWSGDFDILTPTSDADYMFIRVHGAVGIGGSQSIQRDTPRGITSVCRQGLDGPREIVCGRAWIWEEKYVSTADCHFGDSGGPLTSTDRSELVGVVSALVTPRPGIRLCRSVPTATIVEDIEAGRVAGLTQFTLTEAG